MSIVLYEHNDSAYRASLKMLKEKKRAAIIHPTGTGKSFIAFKLCEENPDKRIVWLSPSEYIYKTQLENIYASDNAFNNQNIIFFTYAKLMLMSDDDLLGLNPTYIILDEFHRAGAEEWGRGVRRLLEMYFDVPVLGLSATNIRYLDNQRDMADELFDGNIASEMTLGEAVVRGILTPPKYIISMYSYSKDLEKIENRIKDGRNSSVRDKAQKYLEDLRRSLEMADKIDVMFKKHMQNKTGKYIVFCTDYDHMTEMIKLSSKWFSGIDSNPHIYKAYSNNPETSSAFSRFKADDSNHLKLLFCIDMLNEGIHIDDVAGVILLRPTISPIIYKQQIGRALSASKSTEPVIFDIVNNFENLYSISTVEEEMRVAMTYYRSVGAERSIVNERFEILDEMRTCREIFERLEETLTFSWDTMYDLARKYHRENGNLEVPKSYKTADGYSLGSWIATQRKVRNGKQYGNLSEDRIKKLDVLGMRWESMRDIEWNKHYALLRHYYETNGNLDINTDYVTADGTALGKWLANLRSFRKNGIKNSYLTEERIAMLDRMGMKWSVSDSLWERNYAAAWDYYKKNGNLDVPVRYVTENKVKLGRWIATLRRLRNTSSDMFNLTKEQIAELDLIGMQWEGKLERNWNRGYVAAKVYFEENGNLNVPSSYVTADGFKLGDWISNRRENAAQISVERRAKLDAIGMEWTKPDSWEYRYELAKKYFEEHKNLNVPPEYIADGVWLNKWLNEQKLIYCGKRKNKSLSEERIKRLEDIGMDWKNSAERAWDIRYNAVLRFYEEFGNVDIPKDYVLSDGRKIGNWFVVQRKYYKEGKLTKNQTEKLNLVGMNWGTKQKETLESLGYSFEVGM